MFSNNICNHVIKCYHRSQMRSVLAKTFAGPLKLTRKKANFSRSPLTIPAVPKPTGQVFLTPLLAREVGESTFFVEAAC